jgi:hypothetical protein
VGYRAKGDRFHAPRHSNRRTSSLLTLFVAAVFIPIAAIAQDVPPPPPQGKVLFSRDTTTPPTEAEKKPPVAPEITPEVTDAERLAPVITAYDLDVHLTPAKSALAARANLTVRNDGKQPMQRIVLSLSSTLRWEGVSTPTGPGTLQQHLIDTDADHTGGADEAVVTLATPLPPGESVTLRTVYSGTIPRSSGRLDRIGAPADQAARTDWDEIGPQSTALRGFGEVLWYPVAAAPALLGDGAKLFEAVARARFEGRTTTAHLRLAVEYIGEAPHSAYFCGRLERLTALSENRNVPVAESPGIATAEFRAETLGFRTLSLFITEKPETATEGDLLTAVTENDAAFKSYAAAALSVQPMLAEWYGAEGPLEPLRLIDHPGQPFVDGALVVTPMSVGDPTAMAPAMAEALSHVWIRSSQPWIAEGLAQFDYLLWLERTAGREAADRELARELVPLAFVEPAGTGPGQPLTQARDEVYLRAKSASIFWMLRSIVGDATLKEVLKNYRHEVKADDSPQRLEQMLEQRTGTSLGWFFDDWVYADKGLPDLSIVQVTPRQLPARGAKLREQGATGGWLVAVEVKNDGDAVAEVPVTVRSGTLTATERLRIPGKTSASTRILFEKTPEEVVVGDGEVPEMRQGRHTRHITIEPTR